MKWWGWLALSTGGAILLGMTSSAPGLLPNEVPPTPTPATIPQVYAALVRAWNVVIGGTPDRDSALVLLAHWHLETGGGGSMIQWNVGNFKAPRMGSDGQSFCRYLTTEYVGGVKQKVIQPFVAYPDLDTGMRAYLGAIHGHYGREAWQAVLDGDVDAFAQALADAHYYTAPEAEYQAVLEQRYQLVAQATAGMA